MNVWSCRNGRRAGRAFAACDWNDLSRFRSHLGAWRRLPRVGVLAGVCAGLAQALHVQPLLVRLGFVGAGFVAGPLAVIAYIILAAVLPVEETVGAAQKAAASPRDDNAFAEGVHADAAFADMRAQTTSTASELAALRARLQECDRRTAELERRAVAENLDLDRAIRDLGK